MTYLRGAGLAAAVLLGTACGSDEKAVEVVPGPVAAPEPSTTVPEPTTTTTEAAPEATTTTAPEIAWGPVICSGAGHPDHHEPCVGTRARTATTHIHEAPSPQSRTTRGSGGDWVIPDYIVACESGGSWDAENPSGAAGPYQLMPEHFGGESALNQSREAQHAKAAELWDGGRGARNWEQCL